MFFNRTKTPRIVKNTYACSQDWSAMPGDDLVRRCGLCRASVYDLTGLDEAEVLEFVRLHDGEVCALVNADRHGRVVNGECASKTYTTLGAVR